MRYGLVLSGGRPREDAGATWWVGARWELPHHSAERMAQVRERLAAGRARPTPAL